MDNTTLPGLEDCLALYSAVYDQHGTEPLEPAELSTPAYIDDTRYVLDLAVAYGLLVTDGTTYRVACEPDDPADHWESVVEDRVSRVRRALSTRAGDAGTETRRRSFTYQGEEYASVRVDYDADFEAVATTVADVDLSDQAGVVLRAPGDYANEVQRFADRLGDSEELVDAPFSTPLRKEFSDVEGSSKDDLEFRLFLSKP